jgi:Tfp pilus assembly protein PilF
MAYLAFNQGDKAKATEQINKVLELDPGNTNAPNLKKFIDKMP